MRTTVRRMRSARHSARSPRSRWRSASKGSASASNGLAGVADSGPDPVRSRRSRRRRWGRQPPRVESGSSRSIDEVQELTKRADVGDLPIVPPSGADRTSQSFVVGGGLPNLPTCCWPEPSRTPSGSSTTGRSSRLARCRRPRRAASRPAAAQGVTRDPDDHCIRRFPESGGYPFYPPAVRARRRRTHPPESTRIRCSTTRSSASPRASSSSTHGFYFLARRERASRRRTRNVLRVIAATTTARPPGSARWPTAWGRRPRRSGPLGPSLIGKGIVYSPERGMLAYTRSRHGRLCPAGRSNS